MSKRHKLTAKQVQAIQDGCEVEGFDYYFLEATSPSDFKDAGLRLRISEWRQARAEVIRYLDLEIE